MARKGKTKAEGFYSRVVNVVKSEKFFIFVIALSVIQNLWYALTFQPIIFDEKIHFGSTVAYTSHLSPFITSQPSSLDYLGQITRNTSYLFYYILSWPLRLIDVFTHNASAQLILLRLINIALFACALIIFRKVLL